MSAERPLFPLQAVLFPGGLLRLKVFEARYLDLIADCLRDRRPFGVIALRSGADAGAGAGVTFESVGTWAELVSVDSDRPGILQVRCRGSSRFRVATSRQQADGLWLARTSELDDDEALAPNRRLVDTVRALATTIATLKAKGDAPFLSPYHFADAGWVANRWCEILPISQAAKQKLMELPDPTVRLELVDEFLRTKGVIK
jgi:Lon protease-like protein